MRGGREEVFRRQPRCRDREQVSYIDKGPTPVKNADRSVDYFDISEFAALLCWFVVNKRVTAI